MTAQDSVDGIVTRLYDRRPWLLIPVEANRIVSSPEPQTGSWT